MRLEVSVDLLCSMYTFYMLERNPLCLCAPCPVKNLELIYLVKEVVAGVIPSFDRSFRRPHSELWRPHEHENTSSPLHPLKVGVNTNSTLP